MTMQNRPTDEQLHERAARGDRSAQRELNYRKTVAAADFLLTKPRDAKGRAPGDILYEGPKEGDE
jgi:hypothetical protein